MLVLTQMSAGLFAAQAVLAAAGVLPMLSALVYGATAVLLAGLCVSVFHLGRPLGAWRFFIGLRTSWMSREILGFSLFAAAAQAACAALFFGLSHMLALVALTAAIGLAAVFTSVMIYVDTHRPFWNLGLTSGKFFGTALLLGLTGAGAAGMDKRVLVAALLVRTGLFAWEHAANRAALQDDESPWHASARVMKLKLDAIMNARDGVYLLFVMMSIAALAMNGPGVGLWGAGMFLAAFAAQVMERYVFFVAAMGPRMTGGYKA
jgi:DMSO reductase anchor subunit